MNGKKPKSVSHSFEINSNAIIKLFQEILSLYLVGTEFYIYGNVNLYQIKILGETSLTSPEV